MLSMLEKLINEHGSSTILKERLELFSDKYLMLEEKNKNLSEQNDDLKKKLSEAEVLIDELRKKLLAVSDEQNNQKIGEITIDILSYLFKQGEEKLVDDIRSHFGMESNVLEYHLDILKNAKFIRRGPMRINYPSGYLVTPEGRKYIVEKSAT